MLEEGRIAVILDGLDEIPRDLRPAVLRALSQQATFRLVLLTRSAEMAGAAARAVLQGAAAIELQDIGLAAAADYLTRTQLDPPPRGWHELTSRLRQEPGSPLAQALNNPLMLTLVRDTYRAGDDVGELLSLRDAAGHAAAAEDITGHLLDRVLPAAYTRQPGEPPLRYDLPAAERALRCIATRMNTDGARDLQWWHIPAWTHAVPRVIATWLGAVLAAGLMGRIASGIVGGLALAFWSGIVLGIVGGLLAGIAFGRGNKIPKRIAPVRWRQLFRRRPLVVGLLAGLAAASPAGLPGVAARLGAVLAVGVVAWLGVGLLAGMSRPGADNTSPLSPLSSWRSDQAVGLAAGLAAALAAALAAGLYAGLRNGLPPGSAAAWGIRFGLVAGLYAGFVYPQSWSSSLAFAQLAASARTPVRLMRFLEDARSRGVLRTVGPIYQFRHARLQDRLALQEPATGHNPCEPRSPTGDAAAPTVEAPSASAK